MWQIKSTAAVREISPHFSKFIMSKNADKLKVSKGPNWTLLAEHRASKNLNSGFKHGTYLSTGFQAKDLRVPHGGNLAGKCIRILVALVLEKKTSTTYQIVDMAHILTKEGGRPMPTSGAERAKRAEIHCVLMHIAEPRKSCVVYFLVFNSYCSRFTTQMKQQTISQKPKGKEESGTTNDNEEEADQTTGNNREHEGFIEEKLDRIFGSIDWSNLYSSAQTFNIFIRSSDHNLVLLNYCPSNSKNKKRFLFDKRWLGKEGVEQKVLKAWSKLQQETGENRAILPENSMKRMPLKKGIENRNRMRIILEAMNSDLVALVDSDEIKKALFRIHPNKSPGPDVSQFRPISLYNVVYNVIHFLKNHRSGKHCYMAIKLDMAKIMNYLTSSSFSFNINGEACGFTTPSRGIRNHTNSHITWVKELMYEIRRMWNRRLIENFFSQLDFEAILKIEGLDPHQPDRLRGDWDKKVKESKKEMLEAKSQRKAQELLVKGVNNILHVLCNVNATGGYFCPLRLLFYPNKWYQSRKFVLSSFSEASTAFEFEMSMEVKGASSSALILARTVMSNVRLPVEIFCNTPP
ncbi:retrotransposon protein [Striga asiatica]|uniref:Retrotransposon protein n=1 Tax=Striga asiatica TaxID=4170 RepID=A0A5A7QXN4_STRAF|nr:retrotransposon protein [Striga asiatica]